MRTNTVLLWIGYPFTRFYNVLRYLYRWLGNVFEEKKTSGKQNSIAVLDGVRAIAILLVITYHLGHSTIDSWALDQSNSLAMSVVTAGASGVTLFFVLSGLLLFLPYAKALLTERRWPLARVFYLRRALRILPGYYISLIALILLDNQQYLNPANFKNTALFFSLLMDSSPSTWRQLNGPFWTLAIEWQFYLILPLLVLIFAWIVKRFPLKYRLPVTTICLLSTIAWALAVRAWGLYYTSHQSATWLIPRNVLNVFLFFGYGVSGKYTEDFAVGMLVALCFTYAQQTGFASNFSRKARQLSLWFWGSGILVLVFAALWHYQNDYYGWPFLDGLHFLYFQFSEIVLALGYGSCVFAILFGPAGLKRPFEWAWLRWIGLMSYSLYIWHLPLIVLFDEQIALKIFPPDSLGLYILTALAIVFLIFPFCLLVYAFIERPFIKLSDRWRKKLERGYQSSPQFITAEKQAQIADKEKATV